MLLIHRAITVIVLIVTSISAHAVDYYWGEPAGLYKSATAYCLANKGIHTDVRAELTSESTANCVGFHPSIRDYVTFANVARAGDACPGGYSYDASITNGKSQCLPPPDAQCRLENPYVKVVQFAFAADGSVVLDIDSEIKNGCIYEPGMPENCTDAKCDIPMTPVGNDDPTDNTENPTDDLQKYLDELAKKFDCVKTANGNVGCTNAQQTPPDIDPDDKCPKGYSWSGTTCIATPGGPAENNNSGSGGGGNNGGNNGGGSSGGDNGGNNGGGNGGDDGGGDGGNNGGGGDDGDGDNEVSGTACDQVFKCNGDAIACAIAEKQRASYCEAHELANTEKGFGKIQGELAAEKYQLKEGDDIDVSELFGQGTRFLPSSCPTAQSMNSALFGQIVIEWDYICYYADIMGKFGIAMCSLFFALYVGRAFGGE